MLLAHTSTCDDKNSTISGFVLLITDFLINVILTKLILSKQRFYFFSHILEKVDVGKKFNKSG